MASNQNKFIDRNPSILAAGKLSVNLGDSVANCFKEYTIEDAASGLKYIAEPCKNVYKATYKTEPYTNKMRKGIYTDIRPILQPGVKTRYNTLINELKETTYDSHWNKIVGKGRYSVSGLPKGLNPLETTFGIKHKENEDIKELINPSKGVYQVLSESQVGHELYRKSHNDYNVGERINRNYISPPFVSTERFGGRTKYDPRGIWVRCACKWHKDESVIFTNTLQADFLNKTRDKLGECSASNQIEKETRKNFTYGKPSEKDMFNVEDILKDYDCPPCQFKRDLRYWLISFNKFKIYVKKHCGGDFTLKDLYQQMLYFDSDKCKKLPLEKFYEICVCTKFAYDRENIEPLLRLLSIIVQDQIYYEKFLEILNCDAPPFDLMKVRDVPEKNQYYVTTNQAAACDYLIINNSDSMTAGIPSIRYDLERPIVPSGGCRADLENLGNDCSVGLLTNPSIFCNYGLSYRDFFMPRERQVIRKLFEAVGYKLDDVLFEQLWKAAVTQDKMDLVCVDTFNKLLQKHYVEQSKIIVDEATC